MVVVPRQLVVVVDVAVEILAAVEDPVRLAEEDVVRLVDHDLLNSLGGRLAAGSVIGEGELGDQRIDFVALEFRIVVRAGGLREPD